MSEDNKNEIKIGSESERKWNELFKNVFEKETTLFGNFFKLALNTLRTSTIWIVTLSIIGSILNVVLRSASELFEIADKMKHVEFGFSAAFTVLFLIWILSIIYIVFGLACQFYVQQAYYCKLTSYPDAPMMFVEDEEYFKGKN